MNKKTHLTLVQPSPNIPPGKIKAEESEEELKRLWGKMQERENDALEMKGSLLNLILQHEDVFGKPGFFMKWLETHKIPRTTAKKLMGIAKKQKSKS